MPVVSLEKHAHERKEEMQMFWRRLEGKWIDSNVGIPKAHFQIAPLQQRRELPIAVTQIQDHGQRVVLLGVRRQEVDEEALAAAGRAQHERMADVLHVQVERVRRVMRRFEDRERLTLKVRADALSLIEREEKA